MEWYEKAARLTERNSNNQRYSATGFARILQKYDTDSSKTLDEVEVRILLNKMLSRYEVQISDTQLRAVFSAISSNPTINVQEFANKVVTHRGSASETYTRLMANMLSLAKSEKVKCIERDPFSSSLSASPILAGYFCKDMPAILPIQNVKNNSAIQTETNSLNNKTSTTKPETDVITQAQTPTIMDEKCEEVAPTPAFHTEDPFAGMVMDGGSENVQFLTEHDHDNEFKNKTPLQIWNHIQEEGACSGDHCALVPKPVQEAVILAGKDYNPLVHTPQSSDARDAEIAKALGANIWAQFENREVLAQSFDLNREFNPAPVLIYDHFSQSPSLGFYKGAMAKNQPLSTFIEDGAHNETTHFDTPAERLAVNYTNENGVQIAGVQNLLLNERGSLQLSELVQNNFLAVRADAYHTLNKNGTIGLGGTVAASTQKTNQIDISQLNRRTNSLQMAPMLYKTSAHFTVGAGVVIENGNPAKLRTDFSMLDWWNARNALRVVSDVNTNSTNIGVSIVNETSHFARPTYEIGYNLNANKGVTSSHNFTLEYKKPLNVNNGIFVEVDALKQGNTQEFNTQIGSLHSFVKTKNWAVGPYVQLNAANSQTPIYGIGGTLNMLDIRKNISLQLDAGLNAQKGTQLKPNLGVTLQYTGFSDQLRKAISNLAP